MGTVHKLRALSALVAFALISTAVEFPAAALKPTNTGPIAEWVEINSDYPADRVRAGLRRIADQAGVTPKAMAEELASEYHADHSDPVLRSVDGTEARVRTSWLARTDSGDDEIERVRLVRSRRKSDFFYHPSSTFGFNHGHAGMYRHPWRIVDAASADTGVRSIRVARRRVPKGETYILLRQFVNKPLRRAISRWAGSKVGAGYRPFWRNNRSLSAPFNCSQLIWAAYRYQGFELDSDRGFVYPIEIATARGVYYYKKI